MGNPKERLSKRRAVSLVESALICKANGETERAIELLREVLHSSEISGLEVRLLLASILREGTRLQEAKAEIKQLLSTNPEDLRVQALWASLIAQEDDLEEGLALFEKIKAKLLREPDFLVDYAHVLARANRLNEAASVLGIAMLRAPGARARLMAAWIKILMAKFSEAEAMLQEVLRQKDRAAWEVLTLSELAICHLYSNNPQGAYALFEEMEQKGKLPKEQRAVMAYAAQLAGKSARADALVASFLEAGPSGEEWLWMARIANTRHQPTLALRYLENDTKASKLVAEFLAERGHALRLSGQSEEAYAVLLQALEVRQPRSHILLAYIHTDVGHVFIEKADFKMAAEHFQKALSYWNAYPAAVQGLELVEKRTAWKQKLEQEAKAQFEETHAEMKALKSRFMLRENELSVLREELRKLRFAHMKAEQQSNQQTQKTQERIEQAQREDFKAQLQKELVEREKEVEHKTEENIVLALKESIQHCPVPLMKLLRVAERTFQTALHAELPATAMAVLYSGVLERLLCFLFVERFEAWLDVDSSLREKLMAKATREKRGTRVEYFDNFVAAFGGAESRRIPSMGEILRALEKREESYLEIFRAFLEESYGFSDEFYDDLIFFVSWVKQTLRDPSAHGRGIELAYGELKTFRNRLLFQFKEGQGGLMLQMLAPLAT
ncbi:MAG: tetratricopeptide repeat protein [Cystobacterineae bacterium]|nr:tetratricopeptide repeat protein [Cystobacterineae bacterium]